MASFIGLGRLARTVQCLHSQSRALSISSRAYLNTPSSYGLRSSLQLAHTTRQWRSELDRATFTTSFPCSKKSSADQVTFHNPMLNKMKPKLQSMQELHDKLLKDLNGQSTDDIEDLSPAKFAEKTKQLHDLSQITDRYSEVESLIRDLYSLQQMLEDPATNQDKDLLEMTQEEIKSTTDDIIEKEKELLLSMLPTDTADEANAILEIRAGTGGDEAGLFAADVLRMYERFAERQRWKWDEIAKTHDGLGAIKTQGRIHTSTITVAIMPQPTDVQVHIADSDVRVDVFRASGSGGQKVNTTDSAIRLTHLPTGIVVAIQDERSNQKNRAKAFTILRAKLFELEREKLANERRDKRRAQVGSGTRSEKIRTYNYPQNRVTDHRINKTLHELESVLDGESLPEFIQALRVEEQTDLLMAMNDEE
ncbi:hypothetical protein BG006_000290 [Podila minutissima]|uniref:Peptide chain release factor domain-containing protein n=1 Tax=Podila minutissima TaxID=64525 RepID=A0A9P5VPE3_9FUNG|nr:hypothetical protein BG006_000290 [Podila minutissima]